MAKEYSAVISAFGCVNKGKTYVLSRLINRDIP